MKNQLLSSDELLEILSLSENATAVYTTEHIIIQTANDAMLGFWGKDRSIIGKSFKDGIPELIDQPFFAILQNVWRTGITYEAKDTAATLSTGGKLQTLYFDFAYRAIKNESGEMHCILHTASNVTHRYLTSQSLKENEKKVELLNAELSSSNDDLAVANEELTTINEALHEMDGIRQRTHEELLDSEARFRSMVEQSSIAMLVTKGEDFVFEVINAPMLQLIGKSAAAVKGKPYYEAMPELKGQLIMERLKHLYQSGEEWNGREQPITIVVNGVPKNGYYNVSYKPLLEGGKVTGIMQSAVDVTEQVEARQHLEQIILEKTTLENTLRESKQRLQSILDTMAEGVCIVDPAGQVVYANQMAQKILGLQESEIKERTYNDPKWQNLRVNGTPLPYNEHPIGIILATQRPVFDYEIGVQAPGKERIYISINAAPLLGAAGNLAGGIGTFMDVTARRKDLQQKDDFISIASHELKTPLTSLKGALQLLDKIKEEPSPLLPRLIDQCNKSMDKITSLVEELLDSSLLTQGQLQLNRTTFVVADMLNHCCHHIRITGKYQLIVQGDTQLQIRADEHRIDQVLVNLVNNAVKYAPDSKEILLIVERMEGMAKVSVRDTGPGISQDKLPNLFNRYYQIEGAGKQAGLGLGLYISAEIVKRHGGAIGVVSEVGKGSTFWFTLPMA